MIVPSDRGAVPPANTVDYQKAQREIGVAFLKLLAGGVP